MRKTRLCFAIWPEDGFAPGKPLQGKCEIGLEEGGREPLRNRSGFHCFIDLPAGEYALATKSRYYSDQAIEVKTADLDPKAPALSAILEPNLSYPFPKGTTLLRGTVADEAGSAVAGAKVRVRSTDKFFFTDGKGRFVFYFKEFADQEKKLKLVVTKAGFRKKTKTLTVVKGVTNLVEITNLRPK